MEKDRINHILRPGGNLERELKERYRLISTIDDIEIKTHEDFKIRTNIVVYFYGLSPSLHRTRIYHLLDIEKIPAPIWQRDLEGYI